MRTAAAQDAAAVADCYLRARRAAVPAIPPPVHPDAEVRAWFADTVLPGQEVWVAEASPAVVAMMVLDGDRVEQRYVDPAWTGRGIGSQLIDLAKAQRPRGLRLQAFQPHTRAHRFYERHGFVAAGRTDGAANEERAPDAGYAWRPAGPPS